MRLLSDLVRQRRHKVKNMVYMNVILKDARSYDIEAVIPPKCNRKIQRDYDKELFKQRHLAENAFLYLKHWRVIATCYAKKASSFLAAIHIRCITLAISNS